MAKAPRKERPFPSKEQVLAFILESAAPVDDKEIARAFHLQRPERSLLKPLLKELAAEGRIGRTAQRRYGRPEHLPPVQVIEVTGTDADGELLARPANWRGEAPPPRIYLAPLRRGGAALTAGDRVLARLTALEDGTYEGRAIRVLGGAPARVLGVYAPDAAGGRLRPTDRRAKSEFTLTPRDAGGAEPGELVLAEVLHRPRRLGLGQVRVIERLGRLGEARTLSLISIHEHGIPTGFPPEAEAEAKAAGPIAAEPGAREDLRGLPLVTIDGADARDFDDAVWAEPDGSGWHVVVAIADVAHYVRPGSDLDRAAYERGNSVYFPDRVVPMLPSELSNGWCSLNPQEDRPCLAAHLWLDARGQLKRHRFVRGLMRSAARLTYEAVQSARDGRPEPALEGLVEPVLAPLYGAYAALARARSERGALELDLPERKVVFGDDGKVAAIETRVRLDSHRLIEEFMIAANVAAAETLEQRGPACLFRVHDLPDPQKLEALRQVLRSLDLKLARGQVIRPGAFNRLLEQVAGTAEAPMVSNLVLRSQSQAMYDARNIGHFGLGLRRYAHFTSPIRRYSDLLVHRALISALDLSDGGLAPDEAERFGEAGSHLSMTERRAQAAERDAMDRYCAAFLQDRIGGVFRGRIDGVTRFGLFVTLEDTAADGLVPISSLPDDFYDHVEESHCLLGRRWGRVYRLGESVEVRLTEADPITGGLVLNLLEGGSDSAAARGPAPEGSGPGGRPRGRKTKRSGSVRSRPKRR